jgi:HipA N-terminal domain
MTSEGDNRMIQARSLRIDEKDDFGILSATAHTDTIGAITVIPVEQ